MTILLETMNMPTISNNPTPTPKRKRGAQPGNHNALHRDLFTKFLMEEEMPGLYENGMQELFDELSLAINNTARLVSLFEKYIRKVSPHV
jgi:hypothetical protein